MNGPMKNIAKAEVLTVLSIGMRKKVYRPCENEINRQ